MNAKVVSIAAHRALPYKNDSERRFADIARKNGWTATKKGWPDFLCFGPEGEVIAVEVKPRRKNGRLGKLKREQVAVMEFFSSKGIKCYVSDGVTLEPYSLAKHGGIRPD